MKPSRSLILIVLSMLMTAVVSLTVLLHTRNRVNAATLGSRVIHPGMWGEDVLELQKYLYDLGFEPGPLDGVFEPLTENAVRAFQGFNGLSMDGIVGQQTFESIIGQIQTVSRSYRPPLYGKVIVIDPGHGGGNPGAISVSGARESDNVLAIATACKNLLDYTGARVVMTRTWGYTPPQLFQTGSIQLAARVEIANSRGADIFISIHNNSYPQDPRVSGITTFYNPASIGGARLARSIQETVVGETGMVNHGVQAGDYYVLKYTRMPAVLVEIGYLTNNDDDSQLKDPSFREKAAYGIYKGVMAYLKSSQQ